MHTNVPACLRTYVHTCIRACLQLSIHPSIQKYIALHTIAYDYLRATKCLHTYIHTYIHTHSLHASMSACKIHTCMHT